MNPSMNDGDKVLVTKIDRNFLIGDIIVFKMEGQTYIKRIQAVHNQRIQFFKDGKYLTIDGKKIDNCCKDYNYSINKIFDHEIIVPKNTFFVLGDNLTDSIDSREYGLITENQIIGKVIFKYWPIIQ